jgi:hypothetical protein
VRFPTQNYRASFRTSWGSVSPLSLAYAGDTFPTVLRLLPLALVIPLLRFVADLVRRRAHAHTRQLGALVSTAVFAALSIWYYPDFIHIAFVAIPLLICAALTMQWLIDAAPLSTSATRGIVRAFSVAVATGIAYHLANTMNAKWSRYPYSAETAFGRIDYTARWEPVLMDVVRTRVAATPSHGLFCYPSLAAPYLTTGAKNPTPFQHFHAPVFPARDVARVVTLLDEQRVPYILAVPIALSPDDPIRQEIDRHYKFVDIPAFHELDRFPSVWLYERRPESQ